MGAIYSGPPVKKSKSEDKFETWHTNNLSNTKKKQTTYNVQKVRLRKGQR